MQHHIICFSTLIMILLAQTPIPSPFLCDPKLDCKDATVGDKVPDPEDCEKYYICIKNGIDVVPSDSTFACPTDQYFDQFTVACTDEDPKGTCLNLCKKPPKECNTMCINFQFETVAYVGDCSKYFVCTPSGPIVAPCKSPNLYFNGSICVADERECCDFCTPYCTEEYTQVPDPYDCTKYYFCLAIGPPEEANHQQCPAGKYFNPETGFCVTGTACNNTCINSDSTTSSTTTPITSTTTASTTNKQNTDSATTTTTTTTTSTTTTPTTIKPTTSNGCKDTYICTVDGNYPRCPYCDPTYFNCKDGTASEETCDVGKVFNTNPVFAQCIIASNCPYPN